MAIPNCMRNPAESGHLFRTIPDTVPA